MMAQRETQLDSAEAQTSRVFLTTLVVLTLCMNTLGRGMMETFAVFLLPVEQALNVTRAEISLAYSINMVVYGIGAPLADDGRISGATTALPNRSATPTAAAARSR